MNLHENPEIIKEADDVVRAAAARAAASSIYEPPSTREKHLVRAFLNELATDDRVSALQTEVRYDLPKWTRPPGGVDLVASLGSRECRIAMEMKVGKPDEGIWDAIKLADVVGLDPTIAAGYLIYDGYGGSWDLAKGRVALYEPPGGHHDVADLIAQWPDAWLWCMSGGRGIRPRVSTARISATHVSAATCAQHGGHELRAIRILREADTTVEYDKQGWPCGPAAPDGWHDAVRGDDELRKGGSLPPGEPDACHGYPWYRPWTQSRLDILVPQLEDDAYSCLRRRLNTERNWSEAELAERVDPLRHTGG